MRLANRVMSAHLPPAPQSLKLRISSYQKSIFVAKNKQALRELPDFTEAVALLLETGLPVGVALSWLQPRMTGELGKELEVVMSNTVLGADLSAELSEAATRIGDEGFYELVEKLNMSLDRGSASRGADHAVGLFIEARARSSVTSSGGIKRNQNVDTNNLRNSPGNRFICGLSVGVSPTTVFLKGDRNEQSQIRQG